MRTGSPWQCPRCSQELVRKSNKFAVLWDKTSARRPCQCFSLRCAMRKLFVFAQYCKWTTRVLFRKDLFQYRKMEEDARVLFCRWGFPSSEASSSAKHYIGWVHHEFLQSLRICYSIMAYVEQRNPSAKIGKTSDGAHFQAPRDWRGKILDVLLVVDPIWDLKWLHHCISVTRLCSEQLKMEFMVPDNRWQTMRAKERGEQIILDCT